MKITPTLTESEEELRSFRIESRQCLFYDEVTCFMIEYGLLFRFTILYFYRDQHFGPRNTVFQIVFNCVR